MRYLSIKYIVVFERKKTVLVMFYKVIVSNMQFMKQKFNSYQKKISSAVRKS